MDRVSVRTEARVPALASVRLLWHYKVTMSNDGPKKSKIGRPRVDTEAVTLRLPRDMLGAVDDFRRGEGDLPSRPEAIRRLLRDHLIGLGHLDMK